MLYLILVYTNPISEILVVVYYSDVYLAAPPSESLLEIGALSCLISLEPLKGAQIQYWPMWVLWPLNSRLAARLLPELRKKGVGGTF